MSRYALRTVKKRGYIALVGILLFMHGLNTLKCSVTPDFLLKEHFLYRLPTFCEKLKKICIVEVLFFFNFSAHASSNSAIILTARCWKKPILKVEFN